MAALGTCLQVLTVSNRSSDNNVIVIVIQFNSKKYICIFVNFVKFVCKLSVGVKFPHTINAPDIFTTNEQVVANFLITS